MTFNQIKKTCEYFESPKQGNQGFTTLADHCTINPKGVKFSIEVKEKPLNDIIESIGCGNIHRKQDNKPTAPRIALNRIITTL